MYDQYAPSGRAEDMGTETNSAAKIITNALADSEIRNDLQLLKNASSKDSEAVRAAHGRIDIAVSKLIRDIDPPKGRSDLFEDSRKFMEELFSEGKLTEPLKAIEMQPAPEPIKAYSPKTQAIGKVLDAWLSAETYGGKEGFDGLHNLDKNGERKPDYNAATDKFHAQTVAAFIAFDGKGNVGDLQLSPRDDLKGAFLDDKERIQARFDAIKEKALNAAERAERKGDDPYRAAVTELSKYESRADAEYANSLTRETEKQSASAALKRQAEAYDTAPGKQADAKSLKANGKIRDLFKDEQSTNPSLHKHIEDRAEILTGMLANKEALKALSYLVMLNDNTKGAITNAMNNDPEIKRRVLEARSTLNALAAREANKLPDTDTKTKGMLAKDVARSAEVFAREGKIEKAIEEIKDQQRQQGQTKTSANSPLQNRTSQLADMSQADLLDLAGPAKPVDGYMKKPGEVPLGMDDIGSPLSSGGVKISTTRTV